MEAYIVYKRETVQTRAGLESLVTQHSEEFSEEFWSWLGLELRGFFLANRSNSAAASDLTAALSITRLFVSDRSSVGTEEIC